MQPNKYIYLKYQIWAFFFSCSEPLAASPGKGTACTAYYQTIRARQPICTSLWMLVGKRVLLLSRLTKFMNVPWGK